jgi:AraC-like DNA-binding protein
LDGSAQRVPGRRPRESAALWRPTGLSGVEALVARYTRQEFLPHRHDAFLIGIIEEGVHSVWCRGERTAAGPGYVATFDPGEVHHGGAAEPGGWRQRMLYVSERVVADVLEDQLDRAAPAGAQHFRDCFRGDAQVANTLRRVHEILELGAGEVLEVQTRFEGLLGGLFRRYASVHPSPPLARDAPVALERVREYIHAQFRDPCRLGDLARVAGLRRDHLVRAFQRRFGLPPHRYLTQVRIDAAKELLAREVPASEVAAEIGFADQSHFLRRFKAVVGVTPGRYGNSPPGRPVGRSRLARER